MSLGKLLYNIPSEIAQIENANGFCFVFNSTQKEDEISMKMIEKMVVDGMNLDIASTYIFQIEQNIKFRLPADARKIILLGVSPIQVGLNLKSISNKIIEIGNKQYLHTFSTDEIMKDIQKKKMMWAEVQKMIK